MVSCIRVLILPGKPGKSGILSFTFPGPENACNLLKLWEKPGIVKLKTSKKHEICKFGISRFTFQDVIYKTNLIYTFVISTLSIQTLIQCQIGLGFHWFYPEITWKIHGILCSQRSGNPDVEKTSSIISKQRTHKHHK